MEILKKARAIVCAMDLPEELRDFDEEPMFWDGRQSHYHEGELTPEILASALHYMIDIDIDATIADEASVPLGVSKYKGRPHLPSGIEWPAEQFFLAQLNLAELAEVDRSKRLPKTGMLYLFFNGAGESSVIYWDGDPSELELREYPDSSTLPDAQYYLNDFLKQTARIEFKPYWLIYVNDGDAYDYEAVVEALPEELKGQLTALFGCECDDSDSTSKLYGRAHWWQGEDEAFDDDEEDGEEDEEAPELLLFQDEFGEGNIHIWVPEEASARGDFSEAWMSYSGT